VTRKRDKASYDMQEEEEEEEEEEQTNKERKHAEM
jgi:hypothetical protein